MLARSVASIVTLSARPPLEPHKFAVQTNKFAIALQVHCRWTEREQETDCKQKYVVYNKYHRHYVAVWAPWLHVCKLHWLSHGQKTLSTGQLTAFYSICDGKRHTGNSLLFQTGTLWCSSCCWSTLFSFFTIPWWRSTAINLRGWWLSLQLTK